MTGHAGERGQEVRLARALSAQTIHSYDAWLPVLVACTEAGVGIDWLWGHAKLIGIAGLRLLTESLSLNSDSQGGSEAPDLLDRIAYLNLLDVRLDSDGCLTVDAEKLMHDNLDIRCWVLSPEPDGQWTHGPSGTTASLGASLWAISSTYKVSPSGGRDAGGAA